MREVGRRVGAAEAGSVPRDGAQAALGDGAQQRLEVRARAGVAVHEHDGLRVAGRARLAQGRRDRPNAQEA
jgi:hypothetical protein